MIEMESIPYRRGVQAYIINDKNELLLICAAGDAKFWKIPAGGIEGSESPEETLHREMKEELDIEVDVIMRCSFKNKFDWPEEFVRSKGSKFRGQEQDIFIVNIKKEQDIVPNNREVQEYRWVAFDKINDVLKLENQQESARRVLKEYLSKC